MVLRRIRLRQNPKSDSRPPVFGCVYRRDQNLFDFNAFIKHAVIGIIPAFGQKLDPIFGFGAFFERYLQL
jgi:hypothetical protein